jgi:hypothetical protein
MTRHCDGMKDCTDESDEKHCPVRKCHDHERKCERGINR